MSHELLLSLSVSSPTYFLIISLVEGVFSFISDAHPSTMSAPTAPTGIESVSWDIIPIHAIWTISASNYNTVVHHDVMTLPAVAARVNGRAECTITSDIRVQIDHHGALVSGGVIGISPSNIPTSGQPTTRAHILALGGVSLLSSPYMTKEGTLTFIPGVTKTLLPATQYGHPPRLWAQVAAVTAAGASATTPPDLNIILNFSIQVRGVGYISPY